MRIFPLILVLVLSLGMDSGAAETKQAACRQAPAFELRSLRGETVSLDQFKGRLVLLNFWSTLCGPCVAEMPSLNRLYLALKDRGLEVLAVAIDTSDKPVREFVSENKIGFNVAVDREKEVFFDDFAGPSLPTTYLIDRKGTIVETFNGPREWDAPEMKNRLLKALEKR